MNFSDVDCLTGFLVFCYLKLISILLFETSLVSVICSYAIWYVIILLFFISGFCIL